MLFKVNYAWEHGFTKGCSKPCTSTENQWLAPTLSNVKPVKASDMVIEKPKFSFGSKRQSIVRQSTAARRLFSGVRSRSDADPLTLDEVAGAMYPECPTAVALRYSHSEAQQQYDPSGDVNVERTEECEFILHVSNGFNFLHYAKGFNCATDFVMPVYSESELRQIELETRGQSHSPLWFDLRKGRISASIAHDVFTRGKKLIGGKVCDAASVIKLITEGTSVNPQLPSLIYGRESEVEAVETYFVVQTLDHENLSVTECGLYIHQNLSFLCASPDRIVTCRCCGEGLLEVKCPINCADLDPAEATLPYLVRDGDGRLMLKHTHRYYTQIQMQMAVTDRKWCDFFVYSKCGYFCERIFFNKSFWDVCQSTLETCFKTFVLPSMVASV
jgi:YqaJ-like viral recombinase domain